MYNKAFYRALFNDMKKYIKLSVFANEVGIHSSALSKFMQDPLFDYQISLEKLDSMYILLCEYFRKFT